MKNRWACAAILALAGWSQSVTAQIPTQPGAGGLQVDGMSKISSATPGFPDSPVSLPPANGYYPPQIPVLAGQGTIPRSQADLTPAISSTAIQTAAPATTFAPTNFTPYMLGDFTGPIASLFTELKVAEGNSPRPVDRFFLDFNYFNNLDKYEWRVQGATLKSVDLYRYVLGFEKTFLDDKVSVTKCIPFFTVDAQASEVGIALGQSNINSTDLGNISAIFKGVLCEDKATGSLISAGATISLPTASSRLIDPGPGTVAYLEPFVGFILERGDFFLQGFSSLTLPVARPESFLLFNDIGVGYFVYRNCNNYGLLRSIAPTFEVHVTDPLREPEPTQNLFGILDTFRIVNTVDLTLGTTVEFWNGSTLGVGVVTPVTGPKPFDFEIIAQFNYRF